MAAGAGERAGVREGHVPVKGDAGQRRVLLRMFAMLSTCTSTLDMSHDSSW